MSDEKRAGIMADLAERLRGITKANGYRTDAGLGLYPWLKYRSSNGDDPLVLTYKDPRRLAGDVGGEERGLGEENFLLDVELEAIVADDDDETTIAHDIIRDLRKAIGVDPYFGGLAERTQWISDEIDTEVGETVTSYMRAAIQIFYVAPQWAE